MMRWVPKLILFSLFLLLVANPLATAAVPYFEFGTAAGNIKNGDKFFQSPGFVSSKTGFTGGFSVFWAIVPKNFFHFDIGIQNRLTLVSTGAPGENYSMGSTNAAIRLEMGRIYIGTGYAPLTYLNKPGGGISTLHINAGSYSYFLEGGAIWRVAPELQIAAVYGMEFGMPSGGGISPMPTQEFGLRFRFPLSPSDMAKSSSVKFDGFRYPFGFMRD